MKMNLNEKIYCGRPPLTKLSFWIASLNHRISVINPPNPYTGSHGKINCDPANVRKGDLLQVRMGYDQQEHYKFIVGQ